MRGFSAQRHHLRAGTAVAGQLNLRGVCSACSIAAVLGVLLLVLFTGDAVLPMVMGTRKLASSSAARSDLGRVEGDVEGWLSGDSDGAAMEGGSTRGVMSDVLVFKGGNGFADEERVVDERTCEEFSWDRQLDGGHPQLMEYIESAALTPSGGDVDWYRPMDYSSIDCDLAVVVTGYERSGSTLQYHLLEDAARALGAQVLSTYWQTHLHLLTYNLRANKTGVPPANYKGVRDLELEGLRLFNATHSTHSKLRVLIIKSHEYDEPLRRVCRRQLFYTSHRRLPDVVASWLKLGWTHTVKESVENIDDSLMRSACWRRVGAEDWAYEDFAKDPLEYGLKALEGVGGALGLGKGVVEHIQGDVEVRRNLTRWLTRDAHAGSTDQKFLKGGNRPLPPGWGTVLRIRYAAFGKGYVG